jgi:hypothetical protein
MIEVKTGDGTVQITFPTDGMSAEQINDFITWLRVEAIARRSKLTTDLAWQLSEAIKSDWWERNQQRFSE